MALIVELLLAAAAYAGHFALIVFTFNRLHSQPWPRPLLKNLERLLLVWAIFTPLIFLARWLITGDGLLLPTSATAADYAWSLYPLLAWLVLAGAVPFWLLPKLRERAPAALLANDTTEFDIAKHLGQPPVGDRRTALLAKIPGNEIFRVQIQRKSIRLERLPAELDGLTIAHLSDLHMTGRLTQPFYDAIVDQTNALEPDLIAITGDIAEKVACLPWIVPTLGRLRAKHGKFFILGNHELRLPDVAPLRQALTAAGITDLGSRAETVFLCGVDVLLAGSELPWFGTAPQIEPPARGRFRILLAHTPDEYAWARAHDFDLMLAGHNHGGQFRLPLFGALLSPSRYGTRYAGGLYHEPPTLLHVSRGLAGLHQLRFGCPPELALLKLSS